MEQFLHIVQALIFLVFMFYILALTAMPPCRVRTLTPPKEAPKERPPGARK